MQREREAVHIETSGMLQRHRLDSASGVTLTYAEYVPRRSSATDIVLVHGLASSGLQFHNDAVRFAESGHRVIVPDLRGHGASGVPSGPIRAADFSIATMAQDVLAVLEHANAGQVHWVGNSLGGILALHLLGTPQSDRLESLALFGTCFSMQLPAQAAHVLRLSFLPGAPVTAWLTARTTTQSLFGRQSIETAIRQFNVGAGAAIVSGLRRYDFIANALSYDRPVLVLRGGKDHAVNLRLRHDIRRLAHRPNIDLIDLPKGGHCANLDVPEAFCAALEEHWRRAELRAST
jgi:pimeloyl-ACP methyl ester carboxylesterase